MDATLDLLSEAGMDGVNADAVTRRAGSGKAALYRRWSSVSELIQQAVSRRSLVPPVSTTGELREDLLRLFSPWTRRLDRDERAAAALLGHTGHSTGLQDALDSAVVVPLSSVVEQIVAHHAAGRPDVPEHSERILDLVIRAMWWNRYLGCAPVLSPTEVTDLVDGALVPITWTR